jgi:hypothetical protein
VRFVVIQSLVHREERNMKRVLLSGIAALVAVCFAVVAADAKADAAKPVVGMVKVDKEAKTITLTAKEGEADVVYTVVDTKDGAVAKLDGKKAEVAGKVEDKDGKKTITAESAKEVKEVK